MGALRFPRSTETGEKLYGRGVFSLPIFRDGTIYEREGGPTIERSSGNEELDRAILRIARKAAPFNKIPPNSSVTPGEEVWVLVFPFNFTNEEMLDAAQSQ